MPLTHIMNKMHRHTEKTGPQASHIEIQYVLADTPFNDYCRLAQTLDEANKTWSDDAPSFKVFPHMVARSFFEQTVPSSKVHLGFSFSCLHWLSQSPPDLDPVNSDNTLVSYFKARQAGGKHQADRDLHKFLQMRAHEFHVGGTLILAFVGKSQTDTEEYWETPPFKSLLIALDRMIDDDIITTKTAEEFFPPCYLRSLDQVESILSLAEIASAWSVESLREADVEHPLSKSLDRESISPEDARAYAENMVDFSIAVMGRLLINAIQSSTSAGKSAAIGEEEVIRIWKAKAVDAFLEQFNLAKVHFPWIFVSLSRKGM